MEAKALVRPQLAAKRAFDVLLSAALLLVLLPTMAAIAAAIKATSPGEVVFRQRRAGKDGRLFTIYKFRTMVQDAPTSSLGLYAYRDDPRITRVGRLLRMTSLDELPQLVNVLKGEMSIVGPRPDLPYHVEKYTAFQRQRLEIRPGITGSAQVRGRNQLPWEERIKLDVEYTQHWSLLRDLVVLIRTVGVVRSGRGAAQPRSIREVSCEKGDTPV